MQSPTLLPPGLDADRERAATLERSFAPHEFCERFCEVGVKAIHMFLSIESKSAPLIKKFIGQLRPIERTHFDFAKEVRALVETKKIHMREYIAKRASELWASYSAQCAGFHRVCDMPQGAKTPFRPSSTAIEDTARLGIEPDELRSTGMQIKSGEKAETRVKSLVAGDGTNCGLSASLGCDSTRLPDEARQHDSNCIWELVKSELTRSASARTWEKVQYCQRETIHVIRNLAAVALPRFLNSTPFQELSELWGQSSAIDVELKKNLEFLLRELQNMLPRSAEDWLGLVASWVGELPISCALADMANPGAPIVYVNAEFCRSTGYMTHEILGRNLRLLQGPKTEPEQVEKIRDSLRKALRLQICITNYCKSGRLFPNMLTLLPVFDSDGHYRFVFSVHLEAEEGSIQSRNPLQLSAACRQFIHMGCLAQLVPTRLAVPSSDEMAKRCMLRACLRMNEFVRTTDGTDGEVRIARRDDFSRQNSAELPLSCHGCSLDVEDLAQVFNDRRSLTLNRDYDGPNNLIRSAGNIWVSRCAWLVHWCAPKRTATNPPEEIMRRLWNVSDVARILFGTVRAIDATAEEETRVSANRLAMMRLRRGVADNVLGSLFGKLNAGVPKPQTGTQFHVTNVSSELNSSYGGGNPVNSYSDILSRFEDDVLSRVVHGCPLLARQHRHLVVFGSSQKTQDDSRGAWSKPGCTMLKSLDAHSREGATSFSRRSRLSCRESPFKPRKIAGVLKATLFVGSHRSGLAASVSPRRDGDLSDSIEHNTHERRGRSTCTPRTFADVQSFRSPLTPTRPGGKREQRTTLSMANSRQKHDDSPMSQSAEEGSSLMSQLSRVRELRCLVKTEDAPDSVCHRLQQINSTSSGGHNSSEGKFRKSATHDDLTSDQAPTSRKSSMKKTRGYSQRISSSAATFRRANSCDKTLIGNFRSLTSVDKVGLANAIMKPNQMREAEIQNDMAQLQYLCWSALIDVVMKPALLARPAQLVTEARAEEEALEGYPTWTMRTALCGDSNSEPSDTIWVKQFMPALGDALSSHGAVGLVGVDMRAPGLPLVYVNDGFAKLTKRHRSTVVGRNCNCLQINPNGQTPPLEPTQVSRIAELSAAIRNSREHLVKLRCYDGFGHPFQCVVITVPLWNHDSTSVAYTLGIQLRLATAQSLGQHLIGVDTLLRNMPRTTTCADCVGEDEHEKPWDWPESNCLCDTNVPLSLASWLAVDDPDGLHHADNADCGGSYGDSMGTPILPRWTALLELLLGSEETRALVTDAAASSCSIAVRALLRFIIEGDTLKRLADKPSSSRYLAKLLERESCLLDLTPIETDRDESRDDTKLGEAYRIVCTWHTALVPYAALLVLPVVLPAVCRKLNEKGDGPQQAELDDSDAAAGTHYAVANYLLQRSRTVGHRDATQGWRTSVEETNLPIALAECIDGCRLYIHSENSAARRLAKRKGQPSISAVLPSEIIEHIRDKKVLWIVLDVGLEGAPEIVDAVVQPIAELRDCSAVVIAPKQDADFGTMIRLLAIWSRSPPQRNRLPTPCVAQHKNDFIALPDKPVSLPETQVEPTAKESSLSSIEHPVVRRSSLRSLYEKAKCDEKVSWDSELTKALLEGPPTLSCIDTTFKVACARLRTLPAVVKCADMLPPFFEQRHRFHRPTLTRRHPPKSVDRRLNNLIMKLEHTHCRPLAALSPHPQRREWAHEAMVGKSLT